MVDLKARISKGIREKPTQIAWKLRTVCVPQEMYKETERNTTEVGGRMGGEGRILIRESYQGESSGLTVRLEGSLKTHYDVYSLPPNAYSLLANLYLLC